LTFAREFVDAYNKHDNTAADTGGGGGSGGGARVLQIG